MIITFSRQYSTNGILIAQSVAERLGVHLYDRELVEEMARLLQVNPDLIAHLPELISTPVGSVLLEWRSSLTPQMYVRYLQMALQRISSEGKDAVIVGGGANFALHRPDVLKVRIVAPIELRSAIFRAGNDISDAEARRTIEKRDMERVKFIQTTFHEHVDNPRHYDLVFNLARFTPQNATDLIVDAVALRKQSHVAEGPDATMPQHLRMMIKAKHHVRPEIVDRFVQVK